MGTCCATVAASGRGWFHRHRGRSGGHVYDGDARRGPGKAPAAIGNFLDDSGEELVLHGGSFVVVDDVAYGEFQGASCYGKRDGWFQRGIRASIVVAHHLPGSLRFDDVVANRLSSCLQQHLPGKLGIAGGGKEDFNLVPYELETLRIIEDGDFQDDVV